MHVRTSVLQVAHAMSQSENGLSYFQDRANHEQEQWGTVKKKKQVKAG